MSARKPTAKQRAAREAFRGQTQAMFGQGVGSGKRKGPSPMWGQTGRGPEGAVSSTLLDPDVDMLTDGWGSWGNTRRPVMAG